MAGIPKVKITFDADFDELKRGVKGAQNEVEGFSDKIGKFGKVAAAAFAAATVAAAAYAGKLLIDGVKSAMADEAAQLKLATSLQNVTGATDAQIAAVEEQITKTSLLTGLTDDELRPSLDRLVRATKDVQKAQELQAVAIDVAAGSGKSLEAVTNAMAKAAEGNTAALGKLGVGLSSAQLKTMSMEQITASLAQTFAGQASTQADTFQGKMARLTVAFDEAKETVGSYVLDAITPMISAFVDKGIPAIQTFASGLSESLGPAFTAIFKVIKEDVLPILLTFWDFLSKEFIPALGEIFGPALKGLSNAFTTVKNAVSANSDELAPLLTLFKVIWSFIKDNLAPILGGAFKLALEAIGEIAAGLITTFSKLVGFLTNTYNAVKKIIDYLKNNPVTNFFGIGDGSKGLKASGAFFGTDGMGSDTGGTIPTIRTGSPAETGLPADFAALSPTEQGAFLRWMIDNGLRPDVGGVGIPTEEYNAKLAAAWQLYKLERATGKASKTPTPTPAPTNNVTVNMGVVGDPESAARTIIQILNDSQARGTVGAGLLFA